LFRRELRRDCKHAARPLLARIAVADHDREWFALNGDFESSARAFSSSRCHAARQAQVTGVRKRLPTDLAQHAECPLRCTYAAHTSTTTTLLTTSCRCGAPIHYADRAFVRSGHGGPAT
jgi:hypothetical protein